jgi:hypothetical protein
VIIVSIVGENSFYLSDSVVQNRPQFKGLNLIHKLDDCRKRLINIIEYTTRKRGFDMAEKPEVGWCQVGTLCRMRNSNERIFMSKLF